MARRPTKRKTFSAKDRQGFVLIGVIALALVGLIGLRVAVDDAIPIDAETLCPVGQPVDHLVVVIDKSDPLSPSQAAFVRGAIGQAVEGMAIGERLSLLILDDASHDLSPLFSKCFPGDGSTASPLYQNPSLLRRRFDQAFKAPLKDALGQAVAGAQGHTSPIMEMIQGVSMMPSFREDEGARRRLIIVSDMIHNMPYYSQYTPGADDFDRYMQGAGRSAPTALLNQVDVSLIYLIRPGADGLQGRGHIAFWERWVAEMGGRLKRVDRVR